MPGQKLKIDGREIALSESVTTVGRTADNAVSFAGDPNVSRNHAEIESRNGEYCIIDLGSSNGTTVNGVRITGEKYLSPGDVIVLGGTSRIDFCDASETAEPAREEVHSDASVAQAPLAAAESEPPAASQEAAGGGGSKMLLLIAGGIACIALLFVMIAGSVFFFAGSSKGGSTSGGGGPLSSFFGSSCDAKATIIKPESGDTISAPTVIEVDVTNAECVSKAVFTVDGTEFAAVEAPFTATIDPKEFPDLSDGVAHNLGIVLLDDQNNPVGENQPVALAFETRAVSKPTPGPEIAETNTQQGPPKGQSKTASLLEVQDMTTRLVKQFSGKNAYNVSNKQFLAEVQKHTAEFAQEGYFERALRYRDAINVAFVREQNLDAPLGFLLAMSRSKFDPAKQGSDEGLWRMNTEFITANAYNGMCGGEPISDPSQNCAAKAAALYLKAIVYGVFDGDPIYSAAVFGKSPQDAGVWKATLPAKRDDLWNSIKTPQEREQLVRFFAAGIVAENPQKFGLKKDRPLSELYRLAM